VSSFNSRSLFTRLAQWTSRVTGRPITFSIAFYVALAEQARKAMRGR
jgi:hypothetical protein